MTTIWILVYSFRIDDVYDVLTKAGFKLIREFKVGDDGVDGFEQTYEYAGVSIDVFFFHKDENGAYCNSFSPFEGENKNLSLLQVKKNIGALQRTVSDTI